jgi:hypothetical protein
MAALCGRLQAFICCILRGICNRVANRGLAPAI